MLGDVFAPAATSSTARHRPASTALLTTALVHPGNKRLSCIFQPDLRGNLPVLLGDHSGVGIPQAQICFAGRPHGQLADPTGGRDGDRDRGLISVGWRFGELDLVAAIRQLTLAASEPRLQSIKNVPLAQLGPFSAKPLSDD